MFWHVPCHAHSFTKASVAGTTGPPASRLQAPCLQAPPGPPPPYPIPPGSACVRQSLRGSLSCRVSCPSRVAGRGRWPTTLTVLAPCTAGEPRSGTSGGPGHGPARRRNLALHSPMPLACSQRPDESAQCAECGHLWLTQSPCTAGEPRSGTSGGPWPSAPAKPGPALHSPMPLACSRASARTADESAQCAECGPLWLTQWLSLGHQLAKVQAKLSTKPGGRQAHEAGVQHERTHAIQFARHTGHSRA